MNQLTTVFLPKPSPWCIPPEYLKIGNMCAIPLWIMICMVVLIDFHHIFLQNYYLYALLNDVKKKERLIAITLVNVSLDTVYL